MSDANQQCLTQLTALIDTMRSKGIASLRAPLFVQNARGEPEAHPVELVLGLEPVVLHPPEPERQETSATPPKLRDDGLTDDQAELAYGHVKPRR